MKKVNIKFSKSELKLLNIIFARSARDIKKYLKQDKFNNKLARDIPKLKIIYNRIKLKIKKAKESEVFNKKKTKKIILPPQETPFRMSKIYGSYWGGKSAVGFRRDKTNKII